MYVQSYSIDIKPLFKFDWFIDNNNNVCNLLAGQWYHKQNVHIDFFLNSDCHSWLKWKVQDLASIPVQLQLYILFSHNSGTNYRLYLWCHRATIQKTKYWGSQKSLFPFAHIVSIKYTSHFCRSLLFLKLYWFSLCNNTTNVCLLLMVKSRQNM